MGDEYDIIAERLMSRIEGKLDVCTTEACRKAKAEAETQYKKYFEDGDLKSLGKLDEINKGIGDLIQAMNKAVEEEKALAEKEDVDCPNCGFHGKDKPKAAGKCKHGCARYNEHEMKAGYKKCTICGDDIEWDTVK